MFCVIAKMVFGFGPNGMSKLKQMETYIAKMAKMERNKLKKRRKKQRNHNTRRCETILSSIQIKCECNNGCGLLALEPQKYYYCTLPIQLQVDIINKQKEVNNFF